MSIRDELIKLGATNHKLRPHIRAILAATKGDRVEVYTNLIKSGYYECSDGLEELKSAVIHDRVTKYDHELKDAVDQVEADLGKVYKILEEKYIWD